MHIRVHAQFVQVVVLVKGKVFTQVEKFLQGLVDKDDAYEGGEGFLCEPRDVTDEGTGICGHQQNTEESRPQTDTRSQ